MKQKLFNVFFYLFFFFMINREFNPFGLDLRIVGVVFAIFLILIQVKDIIKGKEKLILKKTDLIVPLFYLVCFFSNIAWLFNGLTLNKSEFIVILISFIGNFLFYVAFKLYERDVTLDKFKKAMKISICVLIVSMILPMLGVDIQTYLMSGCRGYVLDLASNFLGGMYRYGGFAEDPNYASLFMILGIVSEIYVSKVKKQKINYLYILASIFCFLLSASKTTLVAIFPALIMCFIKPGKLKQIANFVWVPAMFLVPVLLVVIGFDFFDSMVTMRQRFRMWEFAIELFKQSPIIGNGLTSVRTFIETSGWWYVQCHSTVFQMISETGLISVVIFCIILTKSLLKNNKFLTFVVCLFSIYMITTETAYHVYFIFVLAILPMIIKEVNNNEKK